MLTCQHSGKGDELVYGVVLFVNLKGRWTFFEIFFCQMSKAQFSIVFSVKSFDTFFEISVIFGSWHKFPC
jgi:hypothetical protein